MRSPTPPRTFPADEVLIRIRVGWTQNFTGCSEKRSTWDGFDPTTSSLGSERADHYATRTSLIMSLHRSFSGRKTGVLTRPDNLYHCRNIERHGEPRATVCRLRAPRVELVGMKFVRCGVNGECVANRRQWGIIGVKESERASKNRKRVWDVESDRKYVSYSPTDTLCANR